MDNHDFEKIDSVLTKHFTFSPIKERIMADLRVIQSNGDEEVNAELQLIAQKNRKKETDKLWRLEQGNN